jgi:hypothetical protein
MPQKCAMFRPKAVSLGSTLLYCLSNSWFWFGGCRWRCLFTSARLSSTAWRYSKLRGEGGIYHSECSICPWLWIHFMAHSNPPAFHCGHILSLFRLKLERNLACTLQAFHEMFANAATAGAAVHVCHSLSSGRNVHLSGWKDTLEMATRLNLQGVDISLEQYPYPYGCTNLRTEQSSVWNPMQLLRQV